jgi:hypothetical protein
MRWVFLLAAALQGRAFAHSWIEQLTVIENGIFTGKNGYPRGYASRSDLGFTDDMMTYLLPPSERTRVNNFDLVCAPAQRSANQTETYPRLSVSPGSFIALKYLENGHVTLPQITPGKPPGSGTVFVFGTAQPSDNELLVDVFQWTADGTGGDQRGKLLAIQNFDDERCYQINSGDISVSRQQNFPNPAPNQPGSINEQWCETDVFLPADISAGSVFTIYWIWQWPTAPGTPGEPEGKDEYYTTCSDVDVNMETIEEFPSNPLLQQDPQTAAVSGFEFRTSINYPSSICK